MTPKFMIPILLSFAGLFIGCGGDPANAHDRLAAECITTNEIVLDCVDPSREIFQADFDKCNETMTDALAIPGCEEIEEEAMSCVQDYFTHLSPRACMSGTPQLSGDLQVHCMDVISRANALHCPDFL